MMSIQQARQTIRSSATGLTFMLCLFGLTAGAMDTTAEGEGRNGETVGSAPDPSALARQIDRLMAQLADEDAQKREEATKALIQRYPQAFLQIEAAAAQVADLEARNRLAYICSKPHQGLSLYRFSQGLPGRVTGEELAALCALAAPKARVLYTADLSMLSVASEEGRAHETVEALLDLMGLKSQASFVAAAPAESPQQPAGGKASGAERSEDWKVEIQTKLAQKVSFEFVDTPAQETFQFLRSISKVNLIVDPQVLGKDSGTRTIRLRMQGVSLTEALDRICHEAGLSWELVDHAVYVRKANRHLVLGPGLTVHLLRVRLPQQATAEKLQKLLALAIPRAHVTYDNGLNLLVVTCSDQPEFALAEAIVNAPQAEGKADQEMRILVGDGNDKEQADRIAVLLKVMRDAAAEKQGP